MTTPKETKRSGQAPNSSASLRTDAEACEKAVVEADRCTLSLLVATHNRALQLERMLTCVEQQNLNHRELRVIVVENACKDNTHEVLARKSTKLNISILSESIASKARAVNRGLEHVNGELVVFTDDDITASPNWLRAYQSAVCKFPSASVFCGPIIPEFPIDTPEWLRSHPLCSSIFFGRYEPQVPEGPLPLTETNLPFGANFAVRTKALKTMRFAPGLGPSEEYGPLYDGDTEFISRLHSQFGEFIFVPKARVLHHIEPRQIEWPAIFEKAFHYGRTMVIRNGYPVPPPHALKFRSRGRDASAAERFEVGCILNFLRGQLHEFRGQGQFETIVKNLLGPFDTIRNRTLLSRSAQLSATFNTGFISQALLAGQQAGGGRDILTLPIPIRGGAGLEISHAAASGLPT